MPVIERVITFFITYPVKSKQRKTTLEVCCAKIPLDIVGEQAVQFSPYVTANLTIIFILSPPIGMFISTLCVFYVKNLQLQMNGIAGIFAV
jgi:hypothetical protein